jgi:hypothetical protein
MEAVLVNGRLRGCKSNLGGVDKLWLFPFVKYSRSQIVTDGNILVSFPTTDIYRFNYNGNPAPSENQSENEGGKFYDLGLSFDLAKSTDSFNIEKLIKKDYRLIFQDRNGLYRIFGLYTGLICETITYNTGSGKSDLNGFNLSFNGQEEKGSFFINDLEQAGFFDAGENYRITEAGEFRITENNNFRITE